MASFQLRGITWKNPRGYDPLIAASKAWMQMHPFTEITWDQLPWYEFENTVLRSLADGDGIYDMIMFDHPWTGKMASENWLMPWDFLSGKKYVTELRNRVIKPSTESYEFYGHQWALPLDAACHAGLFREDLMKADSVPQRWEDISDWARKHHEPPHRYSLILSVEGVLGTCLFLSMMAGLGHPPFTDEHNRSFNKDAAAYVLTILKGLIKFTPPGSTKMGPWDIYERFCSKDDILYSPSIFAYVNYFGNKGPGRASLRLCRVPDFANGNVGKPILGGVGLGISRRCRHLDQAKAFGEFLMSEHTQRAIFPFHSGQPATCGAWTDDTINQQFNNFYTDLSLNMATAYIRPRYPAFHHIELEVGKILQRWWDEDISLSVILSLMSSVVQV